MSDHLPIYIIITGFVLLALHWVLYGDHDDL